MQDPEYFRGKGCVVTGATSGIGYALAESLLQAGAVVFACGRNEESLAVVAEKLSAHAPRVHTLRADVTSQEQVQEMIDDAVSLHGRIDLLFNNAGVGFTQPIEMTTMEQWRALMDANLWSVIYGIHAALPLMRAQGSGHIVNIASLSGVVPSPYMSVYCATKFAVVGLSESLRIELVDQGIHVSVACPGHVATPIFGKPVDGPAVDMKPPADAIPADEAAQDILAGVAEKAGIIVLPEASRRYWRDYCCHPEKVEEYFPVLAQQRREERIWEKVRSL